jgi:hypothetical protein
MQHLAAERLHLNISVKSLIIYVVFEHITLVVSLYLVLKKIKPYILETQNIDGVALHSVWTGLMKRWWTCSYRFLNVS